MLVRKDRRSVTCARFCGLSLKESSSAGVSSSLSARSGKSCRAPSTRSRNRVTCVWNTEILSFKGKALSFGVHLRATNRAIGGFGFSSSGLGLGSGSAIYVRERSGHASAWRLVGYSTYCDGIGQSKGSLKEPTLRDKESGNILRLVCALTEAGFSSRPRAPAGI